jgi:hypothetical protein
VEIQEPELPPQEFQAAIRCEILLHELNAQFTLDVPSQTANSPPHNSALPSWV